MSGLLLKARQAAFAKHAKMLGEAVNRTVLPTRITPAGTTVFRFIPPNTPTLRLDYFDWFRQLPPGTGSGADSQFNRWSGRRADGTTPGVSASYWGSTDGLAAESFFYNCIRGYDPNSGPRRLLPPLTPLLIAGVNERQPYHAEEGAPRQLPFLGNYNVNILIARTVRDIEAVDMDVASDRFLDWNARISRRVNSVLMDLQFKDFAEAMGDSEFKELARLVGNCAYANAHEALIAKSAQAGQKANKAPGYNPSQANNLIIYGQDNEAFTDKLVGTGVIEIRPDPINGAQATLKPVSACAPKEERGLILASGGDAGRVTIATGPSGRIVTSMTTSAPSGEGAI